MVRALSVKILRFYVPIVWEAVFHAEHTTDVVCGGSDFLEALFGARVFVLDDL